MGSFIRRGVQMGSHLLPFEKTEKTKGEKPKEFRSFTLSLNVKSSGFCWLSTLVLERFADLPQLPAR